MNQRDRQQIAAVLGSVTGVLADSVVGVYQYGSAVLGGLRPHSDIDVFVLLDRRTGSDQRLSLVERIMEVSGRRGTRIPGRPVELTMALREDLQSWRGDARQEFQYGEWNRDDYEIGFVPDPVVDPDLAPLVASLLTASRSLIGPPAATLLDPIPGGDLISAMRRGVPGLLEELEHDTTNVLLTLARIAYTIANGRIVTKEEAASWALNEHPIDNEGPLAYARSVYLGETDSVWQGLLPEAKHTATQLIGLIANLSP